MTEKHSPHSPSRLGVVFCQCGGEISERLDLEALRQEAALTPEVVYTACEAYPCSRDGQERLLQTIRQRDLDGILVAGCSPRLIEQRFRQTVAQADLPAEFLEVTNLRGMDTDQQQASARLSMGLARLLNVTPAPRHSTHTIQSALVLGAGLGGLTAALQLADHGLPVRLVDEAQNLGGNLPLPPEYQPLLAERIEKARLHPDIHIYLGAGLVDIAGHPGDYLVQIALDPATQGDGPKTATLSAGAILVAYDPQPAPLGERWYDRSRVKTQPEFQDELARISLVDDSHQDLPPWKDILLILDDSPGENNPADRLAAQVALRQAIWLRLLLPQASITLLYRDLPGENDAQELLERAMEQNITLFRYAKKYPPQVSETGVSIFDPLTQEALELPYDRLVLGRPWLAARGNDRLSALLGVPQDRDGFLVEPRRRLRPGRYIRDGIFLIGGAHQPASPEAELFQAYQAVAETLKLSAPRAAGGHRSGGRSRQHAVHRLRQLRGRLSHPGDQHGRARPLPRFQPLDRRHPAGQPGGCALALASRPTALYRLRQLRCGLPGQGHRPAGLEPRRHPGADQRRPAACRAANPGPAKAAGAGLRVECLCRRRAGGQASPGAFRSRCTPAAHELLGALRPRSRPVGFP